MAALDDAYASPDSVASGADLRGQAQTANTLGLIAVILCLVAPCAGCMTILIALPLSMVCIHSARTVLAEDPDETSAVYARTGLVLGVVSLVYCCIVLMIALVYVMLYVGLFAAVLALGLL
jgi:hypothetical protein